MASYRGKKARRSDEGSPAPALPARSSSPFRLKSQYAPAGDQPRAIQEIVDGLSRGDEAQVLLGITGSGKTFTMANVIAQTGRPTLIIAHNKILAAQLYGEFKELFPDNAVHYFVSYYERLLGEGQRLLHLHFDYIVSSAGTARLGRDHEEIIEAIAARDAEAAEKAAHEHTMLFQRRFLEYMQQNLTAKMNLA